MCGGMIVGAPDRGQLVWVVNDGEQEALASALVGVAAAWTYAWLPWRRSQL
jgi:hypothetical protein